jgi:hypothetical protein
VTVGATLTASLLAVLDRPSTWLLALVGFLVRGGWLIVLAPIVVLPTAVGVANVVAPLLEDVAFGRRTDEVLMTAAMGLLVAAAWLIVGGSLAAATEVETVRGTVGLMERDVRPARGHPVWRVLAVRLVALVPLIAAVGWAAVRFTAVGYRELTNPSDVSTPAAWRIVTGAPDAAVALLVTWLFAEIVGAVAARRVVLSGDGVRGALDRAIAYLRTRVGRSVALASISAVAFVVVLAATALATGTTWTALRAALADGDASIGTVALLVSFVGLFAGCLVLIGLTAAWRSAVWTVEVPGALPADGDRGTDGTFGGGAETQSGD